MDPLTLDEAEQLLADARQALAAVLDLDGVSLQLGSCGGALAATLAFATPPSQVVVVKVFEALGSSGILPFACSPGQTGTPMEQMARGEVLALRRSLPAGSSTG